MLSQSACPCYIFRINHVDKFLRPTWLMTTGDVVIIIQISCCVNVENAPHLAYEHSSSQIFFHIYAVAVQPGSILSLQPSGIDVDRFL